MQQMRTFLEHDGANHLGCSAKGINAETPSPRAFIFSVENAVCEDSRRRQCRRNRLLSSLPTLTSVRILTDSVLQRENKRAWAPGCSWRCNGVARERVARPAPQTPRYVLGASPSAASRGVRPGVKEWVLRSQHRRESTAAAAALQPPPLVAALRTVALDGVHALRHATALWRCERTNGRKTETAKRQNGRKTAETAERRNGRHTRWKEQVLAHGCEHGERASGGQRDGDLLPLRRSARTRSNVSTVG